MQPFKKKVKEKPLFPVRLDNVEKNYRIVQLKARVDALEEVLAEVYYDVATLVRDQLEDHKMAADGHRKAVSFLYSLAEGGFLPDIPQVLGEAQIELLLPTEDDEDGDEDGDGDEDEDDDDDEDEDDEDEAAGDNDEDVDSEG